MTSITKSFEKLLPEDFNKGLLYSAMRDLPSANSKIETYEVKGDQQIITVSGTSFDFQGLKNKNYKQTLFLDSNTEKVIQGSILDSTSDSKFSINSGKYRISFITDGELDKIQFWDKSKLIYTVNLDEAKIKNVYADDVWGKPSVNQNGTKLAFVAEEKKTHTKTFDFEKKEKDKDKEKKEEKSEPEYNKFNYVQTFGEAQSTKTLPEIFILDFEFIRLGKFSVEKLDLSNLKEEVRNKESLDLYPSFPFFDQDDNIIIVGYHLGFKLGLKFCHKRRAVIYHVQPQVKIETQEIEAKDTSKKPLLPKIIALTNDKYGSYNPILVRKTEKRIVYFTNERSFPHMNSFQIRELDYSNLDQLSDTLLIDKEPEKIDYFNGLYSYSVSLINSGLIEDLLVFSSDFNSRKSTYLFDIKRHILINISLLDDKTQQAYGVFDLNFVHSEERAFALYKNSSNSFPKLLLYKINYEKYLECVESETGKQQLTEFNSLTNGACTNKHIKVLTNAQGLSQVFKITELLDYEPSQDDLETYESLNIKLINSRDKPKAIIEADIENQEKIIELKWQDSSLFYKSLVNSIKTAQIKDLNYNGVYGFSVTSPSQEKKGLFYLLHGGPNSMSSQLYSQLMAMILSKGFDVLVVNYPGSSGFGQEYLNRLTAKIGSLDIYSCGEFLKSYLKDNEQIYESSRVFAYGGSHGGFLSSWFAVHEEYSKLLRGCIILNPVIDIYSLYTSSDIPDWSFELIAERPIDFNPTTEEINAMMNSSPIAYVHKANSPILLLIGGKDLRVTPENNGIRFYHALKNFNKQVEMKYYPTDDHPLSTPETNLDVLSSILRFISSPK